MTWLRVLVLVILAQVASAQLCARTTRVRDCEDLYLDTAATSFSNDAGEETFHFPNGIADMVEFLAPSGDKPVSQKSSNSSSGSSSEGSKKTAEKSA